MMSKIEEHNLTFLDIMARKHKKKVQNGEYKYKKKIQELFNVLGEYVLCDSTKFSFHINKLRSNDGTVNSNLSDFRRLDDLIRFKPYSFEESQKNEWYLEAQNGYLNFLSESTKKINELIKELKEEIEK